MKSVLIATSAAALLSIGLAPSVGASEAGREQALANFMTADVDADGALTLSEFTTLIDLNAASGIGRASLIKRFGRYAMAFGRLDGNDDGLVTPEEIQALAQQAAR
ncbi:MAG: hypothetical protein AAF899_04025 [Pseudomonadota bacterium]